MYILFGGIYIRARFTAVYEWINRVRLPNLLVVDSVSVVSTYICTGTVLLFVLVCIPGTSVYFIWGHIHSCTVHCCICILYVCNYSGMYVELVYMYDHHNWARLPILLAVS